MESCFNHKEQIVGGLNKAGQQCHTLQSTSNTIHRKKNDFFCKILASDALIDFLVGINGEQIRKLKACTGTQIITAPEGAYFPGTKERTVAISGDEAGVLAVMDCLLAAQFALASPSDNAFQEFSFADALFTMENPSLARGEDTQRRPYYPASVQLCVPRPVVGSLIGRCGGYVQSVRAASGASVKISPLFVSASDACAERIVTVDSKRQQCLRTAVYTLLRKINQHPDKAACKYACYGKKNTTNNTNTSYMDGENKFTYRSSGNWDTNEVNDSPCLQECPPSPLKGGNTIVCKTSQSNSRIGKGNTHLRFAVEKTVTSFLGTSGLLGKKQQDLFDRLLQKNVSTTSDVPSRLPSMKTENIISPFTVLNTSNLPIPISPNPSEDSQNEAALNSKDFVKGSSSSNSWCIGSFDDSIGKFVPMLAPSSIISNPLEFIDTGSKSPSRILNDSEDSSPPVGNSTAGAKNLRCRSSGCPKEPSQESLSTVCSSAVGNKGVLDGLDQECEANESEGRIENDKNEDEGAEESTTSEDCELFEPDKPADPSACFLKDFLPQNGRYDKDSFLHPRRSNKPKCNRRLLAGGKKSACTCEPGDCKCFDFISLRYITSIKRPEFSQRIDWLITVSLVGIAVCTAWVLTYLFTGAKAEWS